MKRVPERALGLGRIAAQEPRQPAHRAALVRHPALAVLGEQRAQQRRLVAVEQAAARRPLRPSAIAMMTPCSVRMSCWVGSMRVKMLRRLICMVSRLSGGRKYSIFSSSRSSEPKNASSCCLVAGGDFCGIANGSASAVASLNHS